MCSPNNIEISRFTHISSSSYRLIESCIKYRYCLPTVYLFCFLKKKEKMTLVKKTQIYKLLSEKMYNKCQQIQAENERSVMRYEV